MTLVRRHLPTLPRPWRLVDRKVDGEAWSNPGLRATIIVSVAEEDDGRLWLHASIALQKGIPSWELMAKVKRMVAPDRPAYQVHPRDEEHVNIHPNCLHLWVPLEGDDPLPDFTRGTGSI